MLNCAKIKLSFKISKKILKKYNQVIIEKYIGGQEIQVAIINGKPLGAIELVPKENFMIIELSTLKQQKQSILCLLDYQRLSTEKF